MHDKVGILTNFFDFIELICTLGAGGRWFESSLPDQIPLIYISLSVPIVFRFERLVKPKSWVNSWQVTHYDHHSRHPVI